MENSYKKLFVWKKSDELAYQVYAATKKFPRDELYGITSQLRRSALSVPTNIAEGMGRHGRKELRQFLNIALGSLAETEYLLGFCLRLKYVDETGYKELEDMRQEVGRLLWSFHRSITI